jgi:hypothetical protein
MISFPYSVVPYSVAELLDGAITRENSGGAT